MLNAAFAGPGTVDVENDSFRVHNPLDVTDIVPTPILLAALAPVMLRVAGEHASGTILWMADERAIGDHVVPRITKAAAEAGRPQPRVVAGIPVALCRERRGRRGARHGRTSVLGHAEYSPNYQRLLEQGDASDVGDLLAAGDESAVVDAAPELPRRRRQPTSRSGSFRLGPDRAARIESWHRTEAFLASVCPEL